MAREELVSSAVSFLQDPSVASSPLEKRVAFLQSKNLTQEEIDLALSRTSGESSSSGTATPSTSTSYSAPPQQNGGFRPPPPPQYQGYGYGPYGQWQPPPPELPKRDWRDWFIMATVMGGVGYGLYFVTKRYISPLIAPPTPPQIQQDKESIDEQFSRAFSLLDQLSTDTANLKSAEEARTENLDSALREVENVVSDLKTASRRRDEEIRRISDEIKDLKDRIPKAMEGAREGNDKRLKELSTELRSLKVLVGNRVGSGSPSTPGAPRTVGGASGHAPTRSSEDSAPAASTTNGTTGTPAAAATSTSATPQSSGLPASSQGAGTSFPQFNKPASIPAWQMAASNRASSGSASQNNSSGNSTGGTDSNETLEASTS